MDPIDHLSQLFERFPGIGPRQARRFVQFLLRSSPSTRREVADAIRELSGSVRRCRECMRFHAGSDALCSLCADAARDSEYLAIVATDADLIALEKSGTYRGRYFVLGGTVSLASERTGPIHMKELLSSLRKRIENNLKEIILALPANPEGDATADLLHRECGDILPDSIKITTLGRGLSTGSELEYADPETIKSAFESRK